ncbi:MAG: glycosyltransferase [Methylococcaceae bacterium]|nr:glycosyltransferase [Methylococcaceae bacterium]
MTAIRFILVGVVNTLVGLGTIYAAMYFFSFGIKSANLVGYLVGIIVSFTLNKKWTFKNRDGVGTSLVRFLVVTGVAYVANLETVILSVSYLNISPYLAQFLGVFPYTIIGYLGCKFFAFPNKKVSASRLISAVTTIKKRPTQLLNLAIVIPCYNEEEVLTETNSRLLELMKSMKTTGLISENSGVYYVDDGSRDRTWELISNFHSENPFVHGVKLSRNRGHQNALLAGLFSAEGDAIVSIDADLQDDIKVIIDMVCRYNDGYDIIYGVRSSRKSDTFFKRMTAQLYYKVLKLMGVDLVYNHADYRLMSRRVIDCLNKFKEVNLFLRGIIPQLGFPATTVFYERNERFAGESKYPLGKMLALATDGITSFSVVPLRMITWLGLFVSIASVVVIVWILLDKFVMHTVVPGWTSTVLPIYFLGGVQLLSVGILGEYLSKIYMETKQRPLYFIEEEI